ncbi:MAG: type II/IV secretion system ATPase subunit [Candidatus Thermoplasmatota archaeon]|nr:type II/IV secretion system ATPase subunit [Candidatus Thermoplasmatota archaeon]
MDRIVKWTASADLPFMKKEKLTDDRMEDPEFREKLRKRAREIESQLRKKGEISEKIIIQRELNFMRRELDKEKLGVNLTYPVNPPYSFVNITYDRKEGEMKYLIKEPRLKEGEEDLIQSIKSKMEVAMDQDELPISEGSEYGRSDQLRNYILGLYQSVLDLYNIDLDEKRRRVLFYYLQRDLIGWGRADALIKDPFIEDISCNGPNIPIYIFHRGMGSMKTNIQFPSDVELNRYVVKLAQVAGKHVSVYQPILDATLTDGSRINLTLGSEVTRKGSTFTIRKFSHDPISPVDLMRFGSISAFQLAYFWTIIEYKRSLLISGGTASGKTTLMNALCMFVKPEDKVVSIEDTPEIHIDHTNWIQSVSRGGFGVSASGGSSGSISMFDLLVAALRQRPEYVIVGEVRGKEAFTLFQAIAVGHAAMATIHAGSIDELIHRVENPPMDIPRSLFMSLDAVVFQGQVVYRGRRVRRVKGVTEVLDIEPSSKNLLTNAPFTWDPTNDAFKFTGRSFLIEDIARSTGKTLQSIMDEIYRKEKYLKLMDQKNLTYYKDVSRAINEFYMDPTKAMVNLESMGAIDVKKG